MNLHVTDTPFHVSVMSLDGHISPGIAQASNMGHFGAAPPGTWYLNRVKVQKTGQGQGSTILRKLLDTLAAREDFELLIVEPGGYGSDPARLVKFYESHGFKRDSERECWIWRK